MKPHFRGYDDELLSALERVVASGRRDVRTLEAASPVPNAVCYNATLYPPGVEGTIPRTAWHREALRILEQADLVFLDPDNGLIAKSVSRSSAKSIKYVIQEELQDYYRSGKSVIFYNHRCRQKVDAYLERFRNLKRDPTFDTAEWLGLAFRAWGIRDFIFILQPYHTTVIKTAADRHLNGIWKDRFCSLEI